MCQDTHDTMDDAAAEALNNPGEEPDWKAALAEARRYLVELQDILQTGDVAGITDAMICIQHQVIADLRSEVARLLSERDQLRAQSSRTIGQRVKDALYGRE